MLLVTAGGYIYSMEIAAPRQAWIQKVITVYNLSMMVFSGVMAYKMSVFLSEAQTISGFDTETTAEAQKWLKIHAYSRVAHIVDLIYTTVRLERARFGTHTFFFNMTIFPLWGFSLDNVGIFGNGAICFTAMINSLLYAGVYFYWSISVWGKFITPGAHIFTSYSVALYCLMAVHSAAGVVIAANAGTRPVVYARGMWFVQEVVMLFLVMQLMWVKRVAACCPKQRKQALARTAVPQDFPAH